MLRERGRLVWLDIEILPKKVMAIESPSGVTVSLPFKKSELFEVGTNNNTFRVLRVLYDSGKFQEFYGNKARVQFSIAEMAEIKKHSKIIK